MASQNPLDFGLVVGMIDHDGVAGHLALAAHELLQIGQRHPHAAATRRGLELFTMPMTVYCPSSNSGILSPTCFSSGRGQFLAQQDAVLVGGREPVAAGLDVQGLA